MVLATSCRANLGNFKRLLCPLKIRPLTACQELLAIFQRVDAAWVTRPPISARNILRLVAGYEDWTDGLL